MTPKSLLALSAFLILTSLGPLSAATQICSVFLDYYPKEHFEPIGTFFGRCEQSRETIIRTSPDCLEGPYWVLRLNKGLCKFSSDTVVKLYYEDSSKPGIQERSFTLANYYRGWSPYLWIGLTGEDCCKPVTQILAWKIEISSMSDSCQAHSFLWHHH